MRAVYVGSLSIHKDYSYYAKLYLPGRLNLDGLIAQETDLNQINEVYDRHARKPGRSPVASSDSRSRGRGWRGNDALGAQRRERGLEGGKRVGVFGESDATDAGHVGEAFGGVVQVAIGVPSGRHRNQFGPDDPRLHPVPPKDVTVGGFRPGWAGPWWSLLLPGEK